ncbi:hypothetical protein LPB140_02265 [Sphingorhabdus lutea]|uniref:Uncharacterized protein n=1 Tax=Sphingorhabdus lutea TaxID=1913578 RepID=A0A1L3J9P5_9SPHN|nr:hypothetical protein [Sphingorhabdus lutea]APG61845.1 hypothetical protein LPB140_02265 [Sphingorhabdus lutea]
MPIIAIIILISILLGVYFGYIRKEQIAPIILGLFSILLLLKGMWILGLPAALIAPYWFHKNSLKKLDN